MTPKLNPAALTVDELAELLSKAGSQKVSVDQVRADIRFGAPVNGDGTMHLVHYTAWLAEQVE